MAALATSVGCVPAYRPPTADQPHAILKLRRVYESIAGGSQPHCTNPQLPEIYLAWYQVGGVAGEAAGPVVGRVVLAWAELDRLVTNSRHLPSFLVRPSPPVMKPPQGARFLTPLG